jgi:predicted dehydrogenase
LEVSSVLTGDEELPMTRKTIRWGMVGCGDVTEKKSGPGFQKSVGSELVAVMRRNGVLAKDYALRHGVRKWYDNGAALINDPEVDAVYIATPPGSHKEYALMAADVGKPVYVEKPMARSYAESAEMVAYFKERRVPLFVAYYRRAQEKFLTVQELLKAGSIGEVRLVRLTQFQSVRENELDPGTIPWRLKPEISGGGHFMDIASHSIDMLDFLFGPIVQVSGFASNQAGLYPAEDIVTGSWKFASGVHGVGSWCFTVGEALDLFEILGSRGRMNFSVFGSEPIQVISTTNGSSVVQNISYVTPEHVGQPLIQLVVRELLGEEGLCPSTGESALRTARILDGIRGM